MRGPDTLLLLALGAALGASVLRSRHVAADTTPPEILVEATTFARGQASVATGWGAPLSIGGVWAEYDLDIAQPGNYALSVRYAAAEPRPVTILVDRNVITELGLAGATGSWAPSTGRWEDQAILGLAAGKHVLRFQREPCLPHITAFRLTFTQAPAALPILDTRKQALRRLAGDMASALVACGNGAEAAGLKARLATLRAEVDSLDTGSPTPQAEQAIAAAEAHSHDVRQALAGLRTAKLAGRRDRVVVWASSPLVKVFDDALLPEDAETREVVMEACRNEYEPAQVCMSAYDYAGALRARATPLVHTSGKYRLAGVSVRFVGYVPVPRNTPGHPFRLRTAPCLLPDPLLWDDQARLEPRHTQPVWLTVRIPKDALPGDYRGRIEVVTEKGTAAIPVRLHVYAVTLPDRPSLWVGSWGGDTILARELGLVGPEGQAYGREYFDFLSKECLRNRYDHRTRVFSDIPLWSVMSATQATSRDGRYEFSFDPFDRFVSAVAEAFHGDFRIICCGVAGSVSQDGKGLLSGDIVVRDPAGTVNANRGFANVSTDDPAYLTFIGDLFRAMAQHLREKGWLESVYFKVIDEVHDDSLAAAVRLGRAIKEAAPDIRLDETIVDPRMIAEHHADLPLVADSLLAACLPQVEEQIAAGREVWSYNNYRNMIDLSLMHPRMMGWRAYLYGLRGYMHWAWAWKPDAWRDTYTDPFGAGEGFLVYLDKPRRRIVDSLRWEMFRETIEDHDALVLLEQAGGDSKSYCRELIRNLADYEQDPTRFAAVRHRMLTDLEWLCAHPRGR